MIHSMMKHIHIHNNKSKMYIFYFEYYILSYSVRTFHNNSNNKCELSSCHSYLNEFHYSLNIFLVSCRLPQILLSFTGLL